MWKGCYHTIIPFSGNTKSGVYYVTSHQVISHHITYMILACTMYIRKKLLSESTMSAVVRHSDFAVRCCLPGNVRIYTVFCMCRLPYLKVVLS